MKPTLELTTKLSPTSEYKSLYTWFLQEYEPEGKEVGGALIPWHWSLYFKAKNLKRVYTIKKEKYSEPPSIEEQDFIACDLASVGGEFERPVSFSLFGTRRRIDDISLQISRMFDSEEGEEGCYVRATPEWVWEDDFSSRTTTYPDAIFITVRIKPERFDRLLHTLADSPDAELGLMIGGVSGFYSGWSPDIKTSFIKVLTTQEEQKPEIPADCEIDPPTVGTVSNFTISLSRKLPGEERRDTGPKGEILDALPAEEPATIAPKDLENVLMPTLLRHIDQLKHAMWGVVGLLLLILLLKH